MAFFKFGAKKKEAEKTCGCSYACGGESCAAAQTDGGEEAEIKILGSGCKNCRTLLENTRTAMSSCGIDCSVGYVTDMKKIMQYGVMRLPALVVREKVVSSGKVLKPQEIGELLKKEGLWG